MKKEDDLVYRIIDFGLNIAKDNVIVKQELITRLQISDLEQNFIKQVLEVNDQAHEPINQNHIMIRVNTGGSSNDRDWQYRILPTALNSYHEYIELKEARRNAVDARKYSICAVILAALSLLAAFIQVIQGLYETC